MSGIAEIGIVGAGNIGTAMAALLSRSGARVSLAARGPRGAEVAARGVALDERGTLIEARVATAETLPHPVDALFLCVKSQSLAAAVSANRHAITPDTLVIPMVNGMPFWFFAGPDGIGQVPHLDPQGVLASSLSPGQVLGAVLLMTVRMDAAGVAISSNTPTLSLGPVAGGADPARIAALIALLEAGGVRSDLCPDIRQKVLVKLLANLATNPLTALTGATLAETGRDKRLRGIALGLAGAFRSWAAARGHDLPGDDWLVDLLLDAGEFPTSMLQDARAGRALELDAICRAPLELARRDGRDMPLLARLLAEIGAAERLPLPATARDAALNRLRERAPAPGG
ncbi:ketopantoate reductase family protein [Salipiger abyssi]|uniref:ketopantoate reductase family protein n=1 Tax=Salipiger abyssi TaxID=1250539 RepID=UPI001A8F9F5B|nr:2-dehydropantoate 2-reductase N-terminal domain-containing protein [Salipiger abyssi]MBN9889355.1 NAD(P)-binding domain-containing protein [Salipiger abyssi]